MSWIHKNYNPVLDVFECLLKVYAFGILFVQCISQEEAKVETSNLLTDFMKEYGMPKIYNSQIFVELLLLFIRFKSLLSLKWIEPYKELYFVAFDGYIL